MEHLAVGGFDCRDSNYTDFTSTLLSCRWPRLRKLALVNLYVRQLELHGLLLNHRRTLEGLHIRNITLRDDLEYHSLTMGTVLKSLIFLHTKPQLQDFAIRGYIATHDVEALRVEDFGEVHSQLWNIQEFVCHRATFPFPKAARILGLTDPCIDTQASEADFSSKLSQTCQPELLSEETRRELEYEECMLTIYTDSSWYWCEDADGISDSEPDFQSDIESVSDAAATDWRMSDGGVSDEESDDSQDLPSADDARTSAREDDGDAT